MKIIQTIPEPSQVFEGLTSYGVPGVLAVVVIALGAYTYMLVKRNIVLTNRLLDTYKEHANELLMQNEKNRAVHTETAKALDRLIMSKTMSNYNA